MNLSSITPAMSAMTPLTSAIDRLSNQNTSLQAALTSGVQSSDYAGLGDTRYQALALQPELTKISGWQQNVTSAQTTLDVTQTALHQITAIASSLQSSLIGLQTDRSPTAISAAATQAKLGLSELAALADTKNGSSYVFAGTESDTAPITDPSNILNSAMVLSISTSVASVGSTGSNSVVASTLAAASDNTTGKSVFSAALSIGAANAVSQGRGTIVGDGDHIGIGFVLTQGGAATESSTGSSIRDLMRALAVVVSLPAADANSTSYAALVDNTQSATSAINTSLTLSQSELGQTQAILTTRGTSLSELLDALTTQLGALKDSDPALLSTQISSTQSQLTASYSLIADMKGMSLAAYL